MSTCQNASLTKDNLVGRSYANQTERRLLVTRSRVLSLRTFVTCVVCVLGWLYVLYTSSWVGGVYFWFVEKTWRIFLGGRHSSHDHFDEIAVQYSRWWGKSIGMMVCRNGWLVD